MTDQVYQQMSAQQEQRTWGELIAPATNDLTGQLQTHRQTKRLENAHTQSSWTHPHTLTQNHRVMFPQKQQQQQRTVRYTHTMNVSCMSPAVTCESMSKYFSTHVAVFQRLLH